MSIKICVEGGGRQNRVDTLCRRGFSEYFSEVVPAGRQPKIVACGDRRSTYEDFCTSLQTESAKYDLILLLVDSEGPVADEHTPWQHLKARADDNWNMPAGAHIQSAHLMVQCMESWLLADKDALSGYFGIGFLRNSLPPEANVERISPAQALNSLEHAVRPTSKKYYHKTEHGYEMLRLIDPAKVGAASKRAQALHALLQG